MRTRKIISWYTIKNTLGNAYGAGVLLRVHPSLLPRGISARTSSGFQNQALNGSEKKAKNGLVSLNYYGAKQLFHTVPRRSMTSSSSWSFPGFEVYKKFVADFSSPGADMFT